MLYPNKQLYRYNIRNGDEIVIDSKLNRFCSQNSSSAPQQQQSSIRSWARLCQRHDGVRVSSWGSLGARKSLPPSGKRRTCRCRILLRPAVFFFCKISFFFTKFQVFFSMFKTYLLIFNTALVGKKRKSFKCLMRKRLSGDEKVLIPRSFAKGNFSRWNKTTLTNNRMTTEKKKNWRSNYVISLSNSVWLDTTRKNCKNHEDCD